jgi:twinkle protein
MATKHEPCPKCGSRDNLARYEDGHGYCFGCGHYERAGGDPGSFSFNEVKDKPVIEDLRYEALPKRGITEETCRKYGYAKGMLNDKNVQVACYKSPEGETVAQKIRFANKDFTWLGDSKHSGLFGQHLYEKGKWVVVTEGEIDCLTVSQLFNNRWAVVSIPNGAQGAKQSLRKSLDWLEGFDHVILMFDMDEPGRKAVKECAELFSPGKLKVAHLSLKDANECLLNGKGQEVVQAVWNAKTYRPDGILSGTDTWDLLNQEETVATQAYPWADINGFLMGIRKSELVTVTAGSGIGKSLFCRELAYSLIKQGETVGYVALEENVKRTVQGFIGIHLNKPVHISKAGISDEDLRNAWEETAGSGKLFLYDHWGSTDSDNLINRLRYLARGCGCSYIVLDHISIVVSGIGEGDERRLIDNTMTKLRCLVEETGVGLILVSHLKRPEGNKGHEDGLHTSLAHLRGSAAIAQLSDIVIGLERNQQGNNSDATTVRVLKNRYTGQTGEAGTLSYNRSTGRLESKDLLAFKEEPTSEEIIF